MQPQGERGRRPRAGEQGRRWQPMQPNSHGMAREWARVEDSVDEENKRVHIGELERESGIELKPFTFGGLVRGRRKLIYFRRPS